MIQDLNNCVKILLVILISIIVKPAIALNCEFSIDGMSDRNFTMESAYNYAVDFITSYSESNSSTVDKDIEYCLITPLIDSDGQKLWNASIYVDFRESIVLQIHWVLLFDDETGDVLDLWEGANYSYREWEAQKGYWLTWSLEDKALFSHLYPSLLYPARNYVDSRYTVPDAEEMTEISAVSLAKDYLTMCFSEKYASDSLLWLTTHEEIPPVVYNEYSKIPIDDSVKEWHVYCCTPNSNHEHIDFTYQNIDYKVDCEVFIDSNKETVTYVSFYDES